MLMAGKADLKAELGKEDGVLRILYHPSVIEPRLCASGKKNLFFPCCSSVSISGVLIPMGRDMCFLVTWKKSRG